MSGQVARQDEVLAWIDLEMTGLDPERDVIVQLALVLTDWDLEPIGDPLEVTIWQPDSVLERMEPYVRQMHQRSGLLDAIRESEATVADAERQAMGLLTEHAAYRKARLAGNSVGQDRRFLARYMPQLDGYLHYRIVDVSTVKELAQRWYGVTYTKPDDGRHTALADIQQSIEELRYYRQAIFKVVDAVD
ncbi:MAG: oligoribonuclease [Deltaproteobacteria bacterium]|nr:MAG: oligoribonuclease [Deltaproteobacteria bacterium]